MYFLHVRVSDLLGRDDYTDRDAWQRDALRSLADGATFVLMHEGPSSLRTSEVAPLAASKLPAGIYLSEAARLASDPAEIGPVDFIASGVLEPLYRLRHTEVSTVARPEMPAPALAGAAIQTPAVVDVPSEARRGPGRPRKDSASAVLSAAMEAHAVDLAATYPSSREFFGDVLDEEKSPGLSALTAYLGFTKEKKSVAMLGSEAGITRAGMDLRIKNLSKEHRQKLEVVAFAARIERLIETSEQPLWLAAIPELDAWFRLEDVLEPGFADYVCEMTDGRVHSLPFERGTILSPISVKQWREAEAQLRSWLTELESAGTIVDVNAFNAKVRRLLPEGLPSSFESLLVESIDGGRVRRARQPDGVEVIAGFGLGVRPMVRAILMETAMPLHQDRIVQQVRERFQPNKVDASIRNEVVNFALPFGRSTYGLRHHIGLSEEALRELISAAEEVTLAAPDRQWTARELAQVLGASELFAGGGMSQQRVNLALKAGPTVLHDLGRGVWSLKGAVPRRQIHDIVIEALEHSGRPMSNEELRMEIEKSRGTSETFQIQPTDRLIQVARATWGLIERDLPIPESQAKDWLQTLVAAVAEAGHGLHIDEVPAALAARGRDLTALGDVALLSAFARRFGGLSLTANRYFILPEWSDERRTTPRQAVREVIADHRDKTSAQLAEIISPMCGRPVDKAQVLSALNDLGYSHDGVTSLWILAEAEE